MQQKKSLFQYSWLRSFHFTAKWESITKASEYLNLSNSTLSHQIKDLETSFKVKLFYRSGNKIYLTNIGSSLKKITDRYFNNEEDIKAFLGKVKNRVNKILNIGAENPMKVIPFISQLGKKNEKIRFNLFFEKNDFLMEMFLKNKVDILAINKYFFENSNIMNNSIMDYKRPTIDSFPFYTDYLTLVLSEKQNHIASIIHDAKWEKLMEERFLLPHKSFASRILFENLCQKLEIFPHRTMEISSREGIIAAVKGNLGIGVVLKSEIADQTGIIAIPIPIKKLTSQKSGLISEKDVLVEEYIYFNHNISDMSLIKKFIELIKNHNLTKEIKEFSHKTNSKKEVI